MGGSGGSGRCNYFDKPVLAKEAVVGVGDYSPNQAAQARPDLMHYTIKTMLTHTNTLCLIVRFIGLYDGSVFVDDDFEVAIRIMTTGRDWQTNRCLLARRQWRNWL